jgi:hypothetical protein
VIVENPWRTCPPTFAVGVRDALIMYASWISCLAAREVLKCLETCAKRWLEAFICDAAIRTDMRTEKVTQKGLGKVLTLQVIIYLAVWGIEKKE